MKIEDDDLASVEDSIPLEPHAEAYGLLDGEQVLLFISRDSDGNTYNVVIDGEHLKAINEGWKTFQEKLKDESNCRDRVQLQYARRGSSFGH